ncbi:hypothetical protein GCM10027168_50360 [Streptomyces capparidis]
MGPGFPSALPANRAAAGPATEGSAVDVVARHLDADGERLDPRTAAVELLNVVRPTVAVCWFVACAGHALHRRPGEDITVALLAAPAPRLARLEYRMPEQDLRIPLGRVPARMRSGFVISGVRPPERPGEPADAAVAQQGG